jgi:hypothetical protein
MPAELIIFTADCRVSGAVPLADDRLSDMLNSVPRIVVRNAELTDLLVEAPSERADVTIATGTIVAVLVGGRRGVETRRRRTNALRVKIGIERYVVSGSLHIPAGRAANLESRDPAVVLAGRGALVPLTGATITYDRGPDSMTEAFDTILINRSMATWLEVDDGSIVNDSDLLADRPKVYHAAMAKDFTGAT